MEVKLAAGAGVINLHVNNDVILTNLPIKINAMYQYLFLSIFIIIGFSLAGQNDTGMKPYSQEIEANFIGSYYQQDGDNSAVTGGIGTQKLTDVANVFIVNIPLDSIKAINIYAGIDFYSSASTDMIDNNFSSASSKDSRKFATVTYSRLNLKRGETYSAKIGFSAEYDYTSFSTGLSYTKQWNEANSELNLSGQAFFDSWSLIYPSELRGDVSLPSAGRQSYNGQLTFSQILSPRSQISFSAEAIYMKGLLSTPFHRVYFADISTADIERLPDNRLKIPLSVRFNLFPTDHIILRSYYRYYWDDFGIQGHTFEFEMPVKLGSVITLSPFYRYHTQTKADYFAPFENNLSNQEFYTSDYDLAGLSSQKYGMGIKYFPLYGVLRSKPFSKKKKVLMIKSLAFRGAYYTRDTGLNAFIGSLNVSFGIK